MNKEKYENFYACFLSFALFYLLFFFNEEENRILETTVVFFFYFFIFGRFEYCDTLVL